MTLKQIASLGRGEWTQDAFRNHVKGEKATGDAEDIKDINSRESRVLRGGSFFNLASVVRSAYRNYNVPADRYLSSGLRAERTFKP